MKFAIRSSLLKFAKLNTILCGFAVMSSSASAQLLVHKDLSASMAITMAQTTLETCRASGINISVTVVGRNGEIIAQVRGDDTIGAIGASGAPSGDRDEACVKAGIDKVADQLK